METSRVRQHHIDLIDGLRGRTNKRGGRLVGSDMSHIGDRLLEHRLYNRVYSDLHNPVRWITHDVVHKLPGEI